MREGMRQLLDREEDVRVVGEADSVEGALVETERCHPDIILMDIQLPDGNGLEATRQIRGRYPGVKVIVLTVRDDDDALIQASEAGASGYLLKDTTRTQLLHAIRAIRHGTPVLHPAVGWQLLQRYVRLRHEHPDGGAKLTEREREVLQNIVHGRSNDEICRALFISPNTLKTHIRHIQEKLGTRDRVQTVVHALRQGLAK